MCKEELIHINEEEGSINSSVPVNNVGGGHLEGMGVGPKGEPGVQPKLKNAIIASLRRQNVEVRS